MPLSTLTIAHVNLNCRSLTESRPFFEALGLEAAIHTDPAPQDCRAFGFDGDARWDAWMMQDGRGLGSAALDLLEWKEPGPIGAPAAPGSRPGFERLGFTVRDLPRAQQAVRAAGGFASEIEEITFGPEDARRGFGATSPEGQALLVLEAAYNGLTHVSIGCLDLERSEDFYARVFGLERRASRGPASIPASAFRPGSSAESGAQVELEARVLHPAGAASGAGGADPFHVVLTQWLDPSASGRGAAEPHRVGLFRMAFLVADIDACHAELEVLGVDDLSPVVELDLGPSCPSPPCRALFFRDPDGACLELIAVPGVDS